MRAIPPSPGDASHLCRLVYTREPHQPQTTKPITQMIGSSFSTDETGGEGFEPPHTDPESAVLPARRTPISNAPDFTMPFRRVQELGARMRFALATSLV